MLKRLRNKENRARTEGMSIWESITKLAAAWFQTDCSILREDKWDNILNLLMSTLRLTKVESVAQSHMTEWQCQDLRVLDNTLSNNSIISIVTGSFLHVS